MRIFALAFCIFILPAIASAAEKSNFNWHLSLRGQYLSEDTGTKNDAFTLDTRLTAKYRPLNKVLTYAEVSAVKTFGDGRAAEDETGVPRPSSSFLELRQLWLRLDHLTPGTPLQIQLGRQRIREDYALWWNRDLDAARVLYEGDRFKGFIGVAKDLAYYRTNENDEDFNHSRPLHLLGEASFIFPENRHIDLRTLYENDDDDKLELGWLGVRLGGEQEFGFKKLTYRLDLIGMNGDDKTGSVSGWALDGNTSLKFWESSASPSLILGYAYGSPDFRQPQTYGNSSAIGDGGAFLNHYGEVFRPELANLHILTAGISAPVFKASDLGLLYHYYRMADDSGELGHNHLKASPTGANPDIGHELDAVLNLKLNDEIKEWDNSDLEKKIRLSAGIFIPGNAFALSGDELSYRALAEFRLRY